MDNKKLKEIKIYLDEETKEWFQELAKKENKSLRKFIEDSLILLHETSYLENEMKKLKKENEEFLSKIKNIKVN